MFSVIAAVASNGIIGSNGGLPWNIPEELAYFHKQIYQKPVVVGRKTYFSIKAPLNSSSTIVLSRSKSLFLEDGVSVMHSVGEVCSSFAGYLGEIMVIGGGEVYQQFLPLATKLYITCIDYEAKGDTCFPELNLKEWEMVKESEIKTLSCRCNALIYIKKN